MVIDLEPSPPAASPTGGERTATGREKGKAPLPETSTAGQAATAATAATPATSEGAAGGVAALAAISAPTARAPVKPTTVADAPPGQAGRPPLPDPIAVAIEVLCARISARLEGADAREAALLKRVEEAERQARDATTRGEAAASCLKLAEERVAVLEQDLDSTHKALATARDGEKAAAGALAKSRAMDVVARGLLRQEFERQRELVEELGCEASNLHHPHNADAAGYALAFGRVSDSLGEFRARTDARILEQGRSASIATAQYVLACYRSRDPNFSLQPVREGVAAADVAAMEELQRAVSVAAEEVADSLVLEEPDEDLAETLPSTSGDGGRDKVAGPEDPPAAEAKGAPAAGTEETPAAGADGAPVTGGSTAVAGTGETPAAGADGAPVTGGSTAVTGTGEAPAARAEGASATGGSSAVAGTEETPSAGTEGLAPATGGSTAVAGTEEAPATGGSAATAGTEETPPVTIGSAAVAGTEEAPAAGTEDTPATTSGSVAAVDAGDDKALEPAAPGA